MYTHRNTHNLAQWFSQKHLFNIFLHFPIFSSFPLTFSSSLYFLQFFLSVLCEVGKQLWRYQTHNTEWARSATRSTEVRINDLAHFFFFLDANHFQLTEVHTHQISQSVTFTRLSILFEEELFGHEQTNATFVKLHHLQEKRVIASVYNCRWSHIM